MIFYNTEKNVKTVVDENSIVKIVPNTDYRNNRLFFNKKVLSELFLKYKKTKIKIFDLHGIIKRFMTK